MADAALKFVLKAVGAPAAPNLLRRVPITSKGLQSLGALYRTPSLPLQGLSCRILSIYQDQETQSGLEEIVTQAGGVIDTSSERIDAIIFDTRNVDRFLDLTEIHTKLNPLISKINRNGRLVLLGGDTIVTSRNPFSIAATEAVGGFAKSIALELGQKGITANALQIPTTSTLNGNSSESGTIQFFLSKRSAFITGQVIPVYHSKFHASSSSSSSQEDESTDNFVPHSNTVSSDEKISPLSRFSVENKRVIITGAARGIGEYTSRLFAAEGAKLILVDHPSMKSELQTLSGELGAASLTVDVTDPQSPDLLKEAITKNFQPSTNSSLLDVVVHNAGITRDKTFANMKQDQFRSVLDVNLASIMRIDEMLLCRDAPVMRSGGRLVYLSSIAGIAGGFGQTNYSCSKAGVMGYVSSLAAQMGSRGIGINAIAPGFIETEMTKAIPFVVRNIGRRMNALNQGGYPADIAEAALFLSSSASSALNGVTMRVCGKHRVGA